MRPMSKIKMFMKELPPELNEDLYMDLKDFPELNIVGKLSKQFSEWDISGYNEQSQFGAMTKMSGASFNDEFTEVKYVTGSKAYSVATQSDISQFSCFSKSQALRKKCLSTDELQALEYFRVKTLTTYSVKIGCLVKQFFSIKDKVRDS